MACRVKLDVNAGLLEVEGPEAFVREIYQDFWDSRRGDENKGPKEAPSQSKKQSKPATNQRGTKSKGSRTGSRRDRNADFQVVTDLDLSGGNDNESLRDVLRRLKPKSNFERNLVFAHYLRDVVGVKPVTANHIYTCYHTTSGVKIPAGMGQSLRDTANHRAWLDVSSFDDITITTHGLNHLQHEMADREE